jgi:hypothetical protein
MRSHIYLRNRRAVALVTRVGESEIPVERQDAYLRHKRQQHHKRRARRAGARQRQHRQRHQLLIRPGSRVDLQPVDREERENGRARAVDDGRLAAGPEPDLRDLNSAGFEYHPSAG